MQKRQRMKVIGVEMKRKIKSVSSYDDSDIRLPISICSSCSLKVYAAATNKTTFSLPDYSEFTLPNTQRRMRRS